MADPMTGRQDDSATWGKYMIAIAWLLLLALLTLFFNARLERQSNPNHTPLATTVDGATAVELKRNRYGHYMASGTINGAAVVFMLDTGASDVSVPGSIADRIGLQRGRPQSYRTANGTITAWQTEIEEIRLGPLRLGPIPASINPHDATDAVLLGMSFLKYLDFSQQGNTLTLGYRAGDKHR